MFLSVSDLALWRHLKSLLGVTGTFRSELLRSAMFAPQEPAPSITNLSEQPCVFAAGINPLECLFFKSLAENSLVRGSFGNARAGEHS